MEKEDSSNLSEIDIEKRRDNDFFTIETGNSIFKKKSSRCDKFILLNKFISKLHLKSSMIS